MTTRRVATIALTASLALAAWGAGPARAAGDGAPDGNGEPGPEIGAVAPDFSLPAVAGGEVALRDLRGGPVVLIFFRGAW